MGIMKSWFGLMKIDDHLAAINSANVEMAKLGNSLAEEKAARRKQADDHGKLLRDYGTRGDLLAAARRDRALAVRECCELEAELAKFRAQRDKDNAGRRERRAKAKAANDAAPKVAKKGAR